MRYGLRNWWWSIAALAAMVVGGCAESNPPVFRLDMSKMVANGISPENQQAIANVLDAMFGTPDEPFAMPESGLDQRKLTMAAGPVWGNRPGAKRGLYRRHCAHCHGINGDGDGPTASILNPYPRDYRPGIFKFKSTTTAAQPTEDDLRRIVHDGVPGTAMPSFALYPPDEVNALIEYVKYLSIRGQMETALVEFVSLELGEGEVLDPAKDPQLREVIVGDLLTSVVDGWNQAAEQVIVPEDDAIPPADRSAEEIAASVDAGRELFYSAAKGNCMQCHGPTALGDGQQTAYDNWSDATQKFITETNAMVETMAAMKQEIAEKDGEERQEAEAALAQYRRNYRERLELIPTLLPPRTAIPRNLRENVYRGGRRPIDLFWRVSAGIAGTPMPAAPASLSQKEIWQIVDYVQSLPYEPASRPQVHPIDLDMGQLGAVSR